jgi:hypothetical protein
MGRKTRRRRSPARRNLRNLPENHLYRGLIKRSAQTYTKK